MKKPILYSDFDGVIYDTIDTSFKIMRENNCDMSNKEEIDYFFRMLLDWEEVYKKSQIINDAVNKLKYLKKDDIFEDVIILTKLSGNATEEKIKREYLRIVLPEVKVITLQYGLSKASVVKAKDNVLVDDEKRNCSSWNNSLGTAVLFNKNDTNLEDNIVNDLLDIPNTNGVKELIKKIKH